MDSRDTEVRLATKDIYADVEEEGGTVHRLVAAEGQQIPRAFDYLVGADHPDVSTESTVTEAVATRQTTVRRQNGPLEELEHEDFRKAVADVSDEEEEEKPPAKKRKQAANKARSSASDKSRKAADDSK